MKQGEIWNADLNPVRGSEQAGFRPVVIISGNLLNEFLNVIIVVPLTSQVKNYKGNPVLSPTRTNGLTKESEMLMFHVRSHSPRPTGAAPRPSGPGASTAAGRRGSRAAP